MPGRQERGKPGYPPIKWAPAPTRRCRRARPSAGSSPCRWTTTQPGGDETIQLAVSRIKHTVPERQVPGRHAGEPGRTGRQGPRAGGARRARAEAAGDAYDWIGFDPRGVGASKPALTCDSDYAGYNRPAYVPTTPAIEKAWLASAPRGTPRRAPRPAARCSTTSRPWTPCGTWRASGSRSAPSRSTSTASRTARYLGQVYATRYPDRVRRMVLDGDVNPARVWYDSNLDQDIAFDRNIKVYFALAGQVRQGLPPGPHRPRRGEALLRRAGRSWPRKPAGGVDRAGRADRRLPAGRLLRLRLGGRSRGVQRLGAQAGPGRRCKKLFDKDNPQDGRRRQRLRDLPGRAVHRRAVAGELDEVDRGQLAGAPPGAVRDLGQRLVQRALPHWAAKPGMPVDGLRRDRARRSC